MTELLIKGTFDTLYIVSMSTLFALLGGLPIGVLLTVWKKDGIAPFVYGEKFLSGIVNTVRSIPFIILIIALFPFTRYVVESVPALIRLVSLTMITLVGYAAMAGVVGGGGLGDIAIRYGLHRYQTDIMLITIVIMVIMVQLIQSSFHFIANRLDRRRA